ncbi:MAG: hypothetical protein QOG65_1593 [Actinomycetota bacterium]|jgi:hypothetical protein|nr:hypothetical protein [Actinomycetota bacterium]MDQ1384214.1 hypothetical protein [Actinomycetota bacterium]MDQ1460894.1 hypothetical protein [Actinomycetota bacterium]
MATRRTTSNKRERERSKQAKAAAKRERRLDKSPDDESEDAVEFDENSATTDELIERIAAMHEKYDDGQMTFEDFDEEKTELMALLTARLSE